MTWVAYPRSEAMRSARKPFVALRRTGIGFSVGFVRSLGKVTRVSLLVDEERQLLGFRFHNDEKNSNAYLFTPDGSHRSRARCIQSQLVYRQYPWLAAPLKKSPAQRRFEPQWDKTKEIWYVKVV